MPLIAMSPNIQDGGTATPSKKRTLMDFLGGANAQKAAALATKPATPSKLQLVTDADNLAALEKEKQDQKAAQDGSNPTSPIDLMSIDSPLSEMSDGPLSLFTDDAGSSTPARRSTSPNATPCKSSAGASPQVVITIDATPPPGLTAAMAAAASSTTAQPPAAKRKRLTPSEREEKAKADAARKFEKEKADAARKLEKEKAELAKKQEKEKAEAAKKQERDEKSAAAEAKKKAIAEEKEKKRKQKEDEDRKKNEEKEKKRKEKEDEERKVQDAKDKKERSQLRLNSFFKTPAGSNSGSNTSTSTSASAASGSLLLPGGSSPLKPPAARGSSASPRKPTALSNAATAGTSSEPEEKVVEVSEYNRIFKPFFVKENVIMATDLYGMDDETKEAKSRILDEFLSGSRGDFAPTKPFSSTAAVDYFHLPGKQEERGRNRPTVRKIMNMLGPDAIYGGLQSGVDAASGAQTKMALDLLKSVPMKYLFFREDVRPAYFGTVTSQPPTARLSKLARNPLAKTVLPLDYDYDSEAEWVDDGDGEDVDDLDDDEEELDEDGEMSDFLDDSEDAMPLRPAFSGGMEPESTGVCWENERRKACKPELDNFRMEFILDHDGPIDPFSTQYWETKELASAPSAATTSTSDTPNKSMAPPPAPSDAFAALGAGAAATSKSDATASASSSSTAAAPAAADASKPADPKKAGVAAEFLPDLKKSILQYAKLSKLGLVEILSVEFMGKCTKGQIKNSVEALAERTGTGQNKTWKLKV